MNFEPPEPNDYGHCLRCGQFVIEDEQKNGICIDCQCGGAAFPQSGFDQWAPQGGMFLRDYFAAKAMQAFCAAEYNSRMECEHWSRHAYQMADAMLAERAK